MPKEKPKKAVYKQVGEKKVEKHVHHPPVHDENGNIIEEAREEVIEVVVPIMGTVYEEMTQAEIDEQPKEDIPTAKSTEDRLDDLENIVNGLKKIIEGFIKR